MWWSGPGLWWPLFIVMPLVMVACFVVMVSMMGGMFGFGRRHDYQGGEDDRPEHVLAERLASGDIDTEEYERRLAALSRHPR